MQRGSPTGSVVALPLPCVAADTQQISPSATVPTKPPGFRTHRRRASCPRQKPKLRSNSCPISEERTHQPPASLSVSCQIRNAKERDWELRVLTGYIVTPPPGISCPVSALKDFFPI